MRLLLTGATGFVGGAVLRRALDEPSIEQIALLSRRPLQKEAAPQDKLGKIREFVLDDWEVYTDEVREGVLGCDACIWTMGGPASKFASEEEYVKITYDYTNAAASEIVRPSSPSAPITTRERPFRFCYVSGMGVDRNERVGKRGELWAFEPVTRNVKGRLESSLLELSSLHPTVFKPFIFRPAGILPESYAGSLIGWAFPDFIIGVEEFASVLVDAAVWGEERMKEGMTWENKEIKDWARLLARSGGRVEAIEPNVRRGLFSVN